MRRILALAVVGLVVGCGGEQPDRAAPAAGTMVDVVEADHALAEAIPIRGAASVEEEVARDALARLGRPAPIVRVAFEDRFSYEEPGDPPVRVLSVRVRHSHGSPARRLRGFAAGWLAGLFGLDVTAALDERHVEIAFIEFFDAAGGLWLDPISGPTPSADELRSLGERIVARGEGAGIEVETVTGYRIGPGGVRVVVRLNAPQALAGTNNRWASTLLLDAERERYSPMLVILGPDGTPLTYGASLDRGGRWSFAGSSSEEDVSSPPLPDGRTGLDIEIEPVLTPGERVGYRLDCDGGSSRGIRDRDSLCAALEREWITLLPPVVADTRCLAADSRVTLRVEGMLGGVRILREYPRCYSEMTRTWQELLEA